MNAHDITEVMFAPCKRTTELFGQARQQGEKFFKLYAEQSRIATDEAFKWQDQAMDVAARQQAVWQSYVEKAVEIGLAACKVPA